MNDRPRVVRAHTKAVRLRGLSGRGISFAAFITLPDDDHEVRVRHTSPELQGGALWRCDVHGPQPVPDCPHTEAAARVFTTYRENNDER